MAHPNFFDGSSLAPAIPAQHGDRCACRSCASSGYADLLEKSDYQRHEITRLTQELARVKFALAVEKFRRLTLVIADAVARGDRDAWAKAVKERLELGVAAWEGQEPEVVL